MNPEIKIVLDELKRTHRLMSEDKPSLSLKIESDGEASAQRDNSLETAVNTFLNNQPTVLLIRGETGTGKSVFCSTLARELWSKYQEGSSIPLLISLHTLKNPSHQAIEETLKNLGFLEHHIDELKLNHQFIFIIDGYSELFSLKNIIVTNHLHEWKSKVIITCNQASLLGVRDITCLFMPYVNEKPKPALLKQITVSKLADAEIKSYLSQHQLILPNTIYSDIKPLLDRPLFLNWLTTQYRELIDPSNDFNSAAWKQILFDMFTACWFDWHEQKIRDNRQVTVEAGNVRTQCIQFNKDIAQHLKQRQETSIDLNKKPSRLKGIPSNPLFANLISSDNISLMIRMSCLLMQTQSMCGFMLAPLIEYYASSDNTQTPSALNQTEALAPKHHQDIVRTVSSYTRDFSLVSLLSDRVKQDSRYKEILYKKIQQSKHQPEESNEAIEAGNALTVLTEAEEVFSERDFNDICATNAYLKSVIFDRTLLRNAKINQSYIESLWYREADLYNLTMKDVQFAELPYYQHEDEVLLCFLGPNNTILSLVQNDGCISIYESTSGKLVFSIPKPNDVHHYDAIKYFSYSLEKNILAIKIGHETRLYSINSKKLIYTMNSYSKRRTDQVALSRDGNVLVTSSDNITSESVIIPIDGTTSLQASEFQSTDLFALSDDGSLLANINQSSSIGKEIQLWNLSPRILLSEHVLFEHDEEAEEKNSKSLATLGTHTQEYLTFSQNKKLLAYGANNIKILQTEDTSLIATFIIQDRLILTALVFSPDNQLIIAGLSNSIVVWHIDSKSKILKFDDHSEKITSLFFSENGGQLISSSLDGTVRLRSTANWHRRTGTDNSLAAQHFALSPNNKLIAMIHDSNILVIWSLEFNLELCRHEIGKKGWGFKDLIFSTDSQYIILADNFFSIVFSYVVADLINNKIEQYHRLKGDYHELAIKDGKEENEHYLKRNSYLSPEYHIKTLATSLNYVLAANDDGSIHLWKWNILYREPKGYACLADNPSGIQVILNDDADEIVHVMNTSPNQSIQHQDTVGRISPDEKYAAFIRITKREDQSSLSIVTFLDLTTWKIYLEFIGHHNGKMKDIAYSANNKFVAIAQSNFIYLLSTDSFKVIKTLWQPEMINCMSFSPDSQYLIVALKDTTVRLWDTVSDEPLYITKISIGCVKKIEWSNNLSKMFFATLSDDNIVRHWQVVNNSLAPHIVLRWASSRNTLFGYGAKSHSIQNISPQNEKLLGQLTQFSFLSQRNKIVELMEEGQSLKEQYKTSEALERFEKVLKLNPDHVSAHYFKACLHLSLNESKQADEHIAHVLSIGLIHQQTLGSKFYSSQDTEKCRDAINFYTAALKLNPMDINIMVKLAEVYIEDNNRDEALQYLETVLAIDPEHKDALEMKDMVLKESTDNPQSTELSRRPALSSQSRAVANNPPEDPDADQALQEAIFSSLRR